MGNKLFVGNLTYSMTDDALQQLFAQAGTVVSAKVITEGHSGRSKGFGFVEMSTDEEAQAAIAKFNGTDCEGRPLTVSEARPPKPRTGGFGGGESRGGNRGGGRNRW